MEGRAEACQTHFSHDLSWLQGDKADAVAVALAGAELEVCGDRGDTAESHCNEGWGGPAVWGLLQPSTMTHLTQVSPAGGTHHFLGTCCAVLFPWGAVKLPSHP